MSGLKQIAGTALMIWGNPYWAVAGYLLSASGGQPQPQQNVSGPRLNDLSIQTSTYGAPIPRTYGTVPVVGNVFWIENNALKEISTTTSSGGGGKK